MEKRHLFATRDLGAAKAVLRTACEHGIDDRCITVETRRAIEVRRISDDRKIVSMDLIPAAPGGTVFGGARLPYLASAALT